MNKTQKEYRGFPIYVQNVGGRANHVGVGFVHAKSFRHAVEIWMRRMRLRDGRKPRNNFNSGEFTKGEYRSLRNCGESVRIDGAFGVGYFHPYPAWPVWLHKGAYVIEDSGIREVMMALFGTDKTDVSNKFLGLFHAPNQAEAFEVARQKLGIHSDAVFGAKSDPNI